MTTIDELLDIHEIKNLRNLYSVYFDRKDLDKLVALFTPDAVCEFSPEYGGDWEGTETIRKNFKEYLEQEELPWSVMHAITNHVVELTGPDTARGLCYLIDLNLESGNENPLFLFGTYNDVYKKIDGRWLLHRTRIDFLWPTRYVADSG